MPVAVGKSDYTIVDRIRRGKPVIVHGEGTSLWTLTHADDFARAFIGLLGNPRTFGHAFHITVGRVADLGPDPAAGRPRRRRRPTIVHVPERVHRQAGPRHGRRLLGDKSWNALFDNSKVKSFVPGWHAHIPFAEGIRRTVAWFDADPARQAVDAKADAHVDDVLRAWQR